MPAQKSEYRYGRNSPNITDQPVTKIIDYQLGQFTEEKLNEVLIKIENRKGAAIKALKKKKFYDLLFRIWNVVYKQNTTERWT